jgi:hypothetical protein
MSKERDLAELPTTTAEGHQIWNSLDGSINTAIASKPTENDENEDDPYGDHRMETGIDASPFPYGDHRYHTGIRHKWIPVTIRGSQYGNRDCHNPILKWLITVSIWG